MGAASLATVRWEDAHISSMWSLVGWRVASHTGDFKAECATDDALINFPIDSK